MDELELGRALARLEEKLDRVLDDAAVARLAHRECQAEVMGRLRALEDAHRPWTVADAWGATWRVGAGAAALAAGTVGVLEAARRVVPGLVAMLGW